MMDLGPRRHAVVDPESARPRAGHSPRSTSALCTTTPLSDPHSPVATEGCLLHQLCKKWPGPTLNVKRFEGGEGRRWRDSNHVTRRTVAAFLQELFFFPRS